MESNLKFIVDTKKTILSSNSHFYKTENFIKQTKYVSNIDCLLTKICECVLLNIDKILSNEKNNSLSCFLVETSDKSFSFKFKLGNQINQNFNSSDIVFFDYSSSNSSNIRVDEFVKYSPKIEIVIMPQVHLTNSQDFNKLYLISNFSNVNLPRLNKFQAEIVETIDKNILVQGVAGSGKTNICIEKIIFTACKNYSGKLLYTTFSRGLLIDTKLKIEEYKNNLQEFYNQYKSNNVIFLDNNHKKALENRLNIFFFSEDDEKIFNKIKNIIAYLTNKVDYLLIEDIYKNKFGKNVEFVSQDYFIQNYCHSLTNHQIKKCFNKLTKYSKEIIYKEIYGMILGSYNLTCPQNVMPPETYVKARQSSFSADECSAIYSIAIDYLSYCEKNNVLDSNSASKKLIENIGENFEYSLSIIDEVQDYTQVNLCLLKKMSLKLICVGDALQMINPTYFSFGYLKNLLFEKDVTDVKQLTHNYRNTAKIEKVLTSLEQINKNEFGTHNFVLDGKAIDSGLSSSTVFVNDSNLPKLVSSSSLDNFTFVVTSEEEKQKLKNILKNQEVLTVSEIKGLERNTVVLYNILSNNKEKWNLLLQDKVNHKQADENSIYRYYYNLFYVGLSRAKQNLFVIEEYNIKQFNQFFKDNFEIVSSEKALQLIQNIVSKVEFSQQEIIERTLEFIKLNQYSNARFVAEKIKDDTTRINYLRTIEIHEKYIKVGDYQNAGIKFWEYGLIKEAKQQFTLSGDNNLIDLMEKCSQNNSNDLNINIVSYFDSVKDNKQAQQLILDTVKRDLNNLKQSFKQIKENFKQKERVNNGK